MVVVVVDDKPLTSKDIWQLLWLGRNTRGEERNLSPPPSRSRRVRKRGEMRRSALLRIIHSSPSPS